MLGAAPANGSVAQLYDDAERNLLVYPNSAGGAWPELKSMLVKLARDRVQPLAFVPMSWITDVEAIAARGYAPVIISPFMANGTPRANLPPWLSSPSARTAWHTISEVSRGVVLSYSQGKITEGRAELERAYSDAAFWDGLYRATKAVADLPANAVSATLGGAQHVLGGVFGAFAGSWLFWLAALGAAGFAAFKLGFLPKLLGKLKRGGNG